MGCQAAIRARSGWCAGCAKPRRRKRGPSSRRSPVKSARSDLRGFRRLSPMTFITCVMRAPHNAALRALRCSLFLDHLHPEFQAVWLCTAGASIQSEIAIATKIQPSWLRQQRKTQRPVMFSSASGRRLLRVPFRKSEYDFVSLAFVVCVRLVRLAIYKALRWAGYLSPAHRLRRWRSRMDARSSDVSSTSAPPRFFSRRCSFVVPTSRAFYKANRNATRSFFSWSVSFVPNTRLKYSTVSSRVSRRPSCK